MGNVDALAKEIASLARERATWPAMGAANRKRAEEFDWSRIAGRVRDEYQAAIEMKKGRKAAP